MVSRGHVTPSCCDSPFKLLHRTCQTCVMALRCQELETLMCSASSPQHNSNWTGGAKGRVPSVLSDIEHERMCIWEGQTTTPSILRILLHLQRNSLRF